MGERLSVWYRNYLIIFEPERLADQQFRACAVVVGPPRRTLRLQTSLDLDSAPFASEREAAEHALLQGMQWVERHGGATASAERPARAASSHTG